MEGGAGEVGARIGGRLAKKGIPTIYTTVWRHFMTPTLRRNLIGRGDGVIFEFSFTYVDLCSEKRMASVLRPAHC
jgi:RES domain-containing protein